MKRAFTLALAIMLIFALALPAAAATGDASTTGTITVTETEAGETYTLYKILSLESFDTVSEAFSYKAAPEWEAWLRTQTQYVSINDDGYVSWVTGASAAAFARDAMAHIEAVNSDTISTNDITPAAPSQKSTADGEALIFEDMPMGYYLLDSTLGALCSLNTTMPNVIIEEKNYVPTIDKKVDANPDPAKYDYVENITAQIGTVVDFAVKVDIYPGATNYVYHDSMTAGLTYINNDTYPTKVFELPMSDGVELAAGTYTVKTTGLCSDKTHGGCEFEIEFSQDFLDSVTEYCQVTVHYYAILNENAVTYHEDSNGNINYAKLTYGAEGYTEWDPAVVYSYSFELVKTNVSKEIIEGAKFELYDAATDGNKIPLVKVGEEEFPVLDITGAAIEGETKTLTVYQIATAEQAAAEGFVSAEIEVGRAVIEGLALNTSYYLQETEAPKGYNILDERVAVMLNVENGEVKVNGADHMATVGTNSASNEIHQTGGVAVENHTGTILPHTGGMGTTVLYIVGGIMVLCAAVLLVTKKRMAQ